VAGAEHFLRHAIRTAEVAAIGDRDAKIAERALKLVVGAGHRKRKKRCAAAGRASAIARVRAWPIALRGSKS